MVVVGGVGQRPQGRQPPGRTAADSVADAEGHRRPRARALARGRLRRALVRPLGRRRPRPMPSDRAGGLDGRGDREDREGRGGRGARRHPRRLRRDHGRARRPRRRDRARVRPPPPEADHPPRARRGEARDHGDADARVDDRARRADPGRGERRRERRSRRLVGADALRRDRRRRLPGGGGRVHGPDRPGGRAQSRLPPRDARSGRGAGRRPRDVQRGLRHRRDARRGRDPRADGDGQDGVGGCPAAPAPPDRRPDPQPVRGPADGAGVGRDPAAGQGGAGRRGPLGAVHRRRQRRRA